MQNGRERSRPFLLSVITREGGGSSIPERYVFIAGAASPHSIWIARSSRATTRDL
jgi:hypothetical protein